MHWPSAVASTVANLDLALGLDITMQQRLCTSKLRRHKYSYIDNDIMVVEKHIGRSYILEAFNSWHPTIVVQDNDLIFGENVYLLNLKFDLTPSRNTGVTTSFTQLPGWESVISRGRTAHSDP